MIRTFGAVLGVDSKGVDAGGAPTLTGTAGIANVGAGKTFYSTDPKTKLTGTGIIRPSIPGGVPGGMTINSLCHIDGQYMYLIDRNNNTVLYKYDYNGTLIYSKTGVTNLKGYCKDGYITYSYDGAYTHRRYNEAGTLLTTYTVCQAMYDYVVHRDNYIIGVSYSQTLIDLVYDNNTTLTYYAQRGNYYAMDEQNNVLIMDTGSNGKINYFLTGSYDLKTYNYPTLLLAGIKLI